MAIDTAKRDASADVRITPNKERVDLPASPPDLFDAPPISPPAFDPAIRQQATNWLASGLTAGSILDPHRQGGYAGLTQLNLPSDKEAPEAGNFRFWHCDDLLDSAAVLVDRFLLTQAEWRDKLARSFGVECEIAEYLDNEKTYADEVANGLYEVPSIEAAQEAVAADKEVSLGAQALEKSRAVYFDWYSGAKMSRQTNLASNIGYVNAVPLSKVGFDEDWHDYRPQIPSEPTNNGRESYKSWYASIFASEQAAFQIGVSETQAGTDWYRQGATVESARARLTGLKRRDQWEVLNKGYRRQRMDAQRKQADSKVGAATLAGGALNYREQLAPLVTRMARDAVDALARLAPAASGLKAVYGRDVALPDSVAGAVGSGSVTHAAMDDASEWVRNALAWLTAFKQLDQNLIVPISIRSYVGEDQWRDGLGKGSWTITIPPAAFFGGVSHVRLRGLRAYVYGCDSEAGYWYLAARVPTSGAVSHGKGTTPPPLDQAHIPAVYVANAGARSNFTDVPYVGMHSTFNASPVGTWQISMSAKSTQRLALSSISDVEIELALAARPLADASPMLGVPELES